MAEEIDWKAKGAEADSFAEKQISDAAAKGAVNRDFYGAALFALRSARQDEILPAIGEYGESKYTVQQGLKAACHARQDVTAILAIQMSLLQRLQGLRVLAWVCMGFLAYIAYRVS
jgi:hypothetical protein